MTEQEQKIEMVNLARSLFERGYTVWRKRATSLCV